MSPVRPLTFVKFKELKPPHSLWEEFFGPYPWFYAPFAGSMVSNNGLKIAQIYDDYRLTVAHSVPELWHRSFQWGQWDSISQVQFRAVLSQDLIRLDKALITIALVEAARWNIGTNLILAPGANLLDVSDYHHSVIPSTFVIDGADRMFRNEDVLHELMIRTGQRRILFEELLRGYAVVEYIADEIVTICRAMGEHRIEMRLLKDRRDGIRGKLVRPIAAQQLDLDKIRRFYDFD